MLADLLEGTRERTVDELERRAAAGESTEVSVGGRRRRLSGLLEEVIGTLRRGGGEGARQPLAPFANPARELRERALVRRYLIEAMEDGRLEASLTETAIVAGWEGQADRTRLREQNDRLRALLDDIEESAGLFAPDGRILYCNTRASQRLRDVVGVAHDDVLGKTPAELGVPSELVIGRPIEELKRLAHRHERFEMTVAGRLKEGRFNAVYGQDGRVAAVSLVVGDIHNRRLAQTRLSVLTKLNALVGVLEYDELAEALARVPIPELADWCAVNFVENQRIHRSFVAQRDPSKTGLRDAIMRAIPRWNRHPLWQEMLTSGFQLLTEVSDDFLRRMTTSQERYELFAQLGLRSLLVVPMVSRGKITGIITLAYTEESGRRYGRDDPPLAEELALHAAHTFENARLMKDLKASETRFRIALGSAATAVYEQDASLRYVWYHNPIAGTNLLGKTHEEGFPPDEAALLTAAKRRALEEGEAIHHELDLTFGTDERRHYRETIEPLRDSSGRITGVIGAATDITNQHRAQQQLTAELEFRERMMGILGHDLRNPLNAVIIAVDLMLRDEALPAAGRTRLLRIRRSAGRMHEMIETLLDFTRARSMGRIPVSRLPNDLGEISRTAIDEIRAGWPDNPIELQVEGDSHGEWDPARMAQTIANLVANAITYGESGTSVQVAVEAAGGDGDVDLKVHNQGPPIPAQLLPVLFQPFRRGGPEDRSPGGLGLGLYIVSEIVKAHDGSIAVDSTERDGTTFTLHLPRHGAAAAGAAPIGPAP